MKMNYFEDLYLKHALKYKEEYYNTSWWKFKKRRELRDNWKTSLDLMVMYSNTIKNR
jgi:hypothetical protein